MKGIIAINKAGYIGLNNDLPWRSSEDLQHFKKLTMGGSLLVGYRTAQTLPKLPGRTIIVHDRNNVDTNYDLADWCIGGKATYEHFCDRFTELHISHIHDYTDGDTPEPDFRNLNPQCRVYHYYFKTN